MKNSKIIPLADNVLIKPINAADTTPSGIILPDSAKEKPQVGEIMAVGDGKIGPKGDKQTMNPALKVGKKVMYKKWGGNEVKVGNEEWTIISQEDILAIVE